MQIVKQLTEAAHAEAGVALGVGTSDSGAVSLACRGEVYAYDTSLGHESPRILHNGYLPHAGVRSVTASILAGLQEGLTCE